MHERNAGMVLGRPVFTARGRRHAPALPEQRAAWIDALTDDPVAGLSSVEGPFAVAVPGPDGCLLLGVDRFARESLCYSAGPAGLRVAARADALAERNPALDPQALFDYLFFHVIPSPRTVFRDVRRLPPGHWARCDGNDVTVDRYWVPTFEPPARAPTFERARSEFLDLLGKAVEQQLDGGRPGCFLSGGTDSSTVAGLIAKASGRQAATFSIGFDAEGYDEMAFARIAARHFGTDHHEYYVTPDDLVRTIPDVAASFDQPFGNSSVLPAYHCARIAREAGVSRLLAGDGGDELFGGNSRYAKQQVFDAYSHLPQWLRSRLLEPLFARRSDARWALARKASSYIEQASLPMPERTHLYNLLLRLGVDEVLEPAFIASVDPGDPARQQRGVWESSRTDDLLDRTLAFDWRYTLAESDLPKVRAATSLAGVEVGYPMLDERLVVFSQRLPADWKLRRLKLRWFFKEALRGFLPEEIILKKKQGFGLPFGVWATRHQELMRLARDSLSSLSTRGIVRPQFLRNLIEHRLQEHPGYFGEMIWILMMLEQWLRHHAPDYRHG